MSHTVSTSEKSAANSFAALTARLGEIRSSLLKLEGDFHKQLSALDPAWRKSAGNLLHYLGLRRHDIRQVQEELAVLGLSSLGRSEAHVMSTLDAVLNALERLKGAPPAAAATGEYVSFGEGRSLLSQHTEMLLGPAPGHRCVRIMVTVGAEAADDYSLVRDLVSHGMDCMRINCAHDSRAVWARMAGHLERARQELALPCRILMDLAGPKLRTGPMEPGPQVTAWHPKRDNLGRVVEPARIWLVPEGTPYAPAAGADASVPVPGEWLAALRPGETIRFKDARHKRRVMEIADGSAAGRWAQCEQTAYLSPGTVLSRASVEQHAGSEAKVGWLPFLRQDILLKKGDELLLTSEPIAGNPAQISPTGEVLNPAHISCTLSQIFQQVRPAESVWFDDGKIGGIIREVRPDAIRVEITHVKPAGARLGADKGINLPDTKIKLPAITPKDLQDLPFVVEHADLIGMSFVRHERDVYELQDRLADLNGRRLGIVLKIETRQAFERLPNLMLAAMRHGAAGVMIARGDLAVECGYERMAEVQEEILWICEAAHMPVIWATQVLESLAKKGQPSRAEITDAAMGERAECVMLNKGPHIVEAVTALDDILRRMQDHQTKKSSRLRSLHLSMIKDQEETFTSAS